MTPLNEIMNHIARVRDRAALFSRAVRDPFPVAVGGVGARFRVDSVRELWRHRDLSEEHELIEAVLSELGEDDVFWDIGANVGTYSVLASLKGAEVHAFEPYPPSRDRLKENAELNDASLTIHGYALGAKNTTMRLQIGGNQAVGTHQLNRDGDIDVDVKRADEVDAPLPDVVKLDVEGAEVDVLRGASEVLAHARWVIVETHPQNGVDPEEVKELLIEHFTNVSVPESDRAEPFLIARR